MRALQSLLARREAEPKIEQTSAYTRTLLKELGDPNQEAERDEPVNGLGKLKSRVATAMGGASEAEEATPIDPVAEPEVSPPRRPELTSSEEDFIETACRHYRQGDFTNAFAVCKLAADSGDPRGMNLLGCLYRDGQGIAQDHNEAARWLRRAAEAGHAGAMVNLGRMCADGLGTELDEGQAARWFRRAADLDDPDGMHCLGLMHWHGRGVHQDDEEAVCWLERAAEARQSDAMFYLAFAYASGRGVSQNLRQAAAHYRQAADLGHAQAQLHLGCMHGKGVGVMRDYVRAHAWFNLAASQGLQEAFEIRDDIAGVMTPDQLLEAQELALEWQRKRRSEGSPTTPAQVGAVPVQDGLTPNTL